MRLCARMNAQTWAKERYEMQGFVWAIIFWAFSAVPELGRTFATPCESCSSSEPLCLQWKSAKFGGMGKVITVEKRENVSLLFLMFAFLKSYKFCFLVIRI